MVSGQREGRPLLEMATATVDTHPTGMHSCCSQNQHISL